jgi:hypothetical protein
VRSLFVRNIPKSGRTPDDLLAYVHVSVAEIVRTAAELAGGGADGPSAIPLRLPTHRRQRPPAKQAP